MDTKLFNAELRYYALMQLAKRMLDEGEITKKEYTFIQRKMRQKYNPFITNADK